MDFICLPYYQRHNCTNLPTATTLTEQPPLRYYQTQPYLPVYTNHFTITNTSLPYYRTQLYLLAYRNHITITSTCLPYYQRHNYTHLPTATTLQKYPYVYHTTRDTTVFTCLQQPPYNNIHLYTILQATRLYLLA